MHEDTETHETLLISARIPGAGSSDQPEPSQRAARFPTAMQDRGEMHETLENAFDPEPAGARWIAYREPFQRSSSRPSRPPTAMHADREPHGTACSGPRPRIGTSVHPGAALALEASPNNVPMINAANIPATYAPRRVRRSPNLIPVPTTPSGEVAPQHIESAGLIESSTTPSLGTGRFPSSPGVSGVQRHEAEWTSARGPQSPHFPI
jgi:hypothetical protein